MEQDANYKKKVKILKKIFLMGRERRGEEEKGRVGYGG